MSLNLDKSVWQRVAFRDVVRNVNETVKDPSGAGIERVIAMEHMDPGELKIERWGSVADGTTFARRVKPGQTLFGKRRAYQRKVSFAEFDAICSGDIYTFEADDIQMLAEFLPFVVQSNEFFDYALDTSAGSLSPRTNWRELANFEFDLPPLNEQKRLADLLWAVERHRLKVLERTRLAEIAKSTRFVSWLREGISASGWEACAIPSIVLSGPSNGKSAPANDEARGTPTLSISAVRANGVRGGDSIKYIEVDPNSVARFRLEPDDFLIVRGNGNRQLTGRGGLVTDGLPAGCIYPDLLIRLRFDEARILPQFAAEQWNSPTIHAALLENAKTTNGIWKINGQDIKAHRLTVPPLSDQIEILIELESFSVALTHARSEIDALGKVRRALLDEIFGDN